MKKLTAASMAMSADATAMRKALMEIRDICLRVGVNISPTSKKYQSRECQTIVACFRKAADALSAPPRNCDLYEDHEDSWDAFCKERDATGRGDSYPYDEYEMWLFRKAVAPGQSVWFDRKRS